MKKSDKKLESHCNLVKNFELDSLKKVVISGV